MTDTKVKSLTELLNDIDRQANDAHGSEKYTIRALAALVESNDQLIRSNELVKAAIEKFEQSTIKTERIMIFLAVAQLFLAIIASLQLIL